MISRRGLIETLFVLISGLISGAVVSLAASATEQSPKEFLDAIYKNYVGTNSKGATLDKPSTKRLFTPSLRKAIDDDAKAAATRNEVGNLDWDPFIDGQDWDIKSFDISVQDGGPRKAKGIVKFKNAGHDTTIIFDLVKSAGSWHIDEMTTAEGTTTLRKVLSGK